MSSDTYEPVYADVNIEYGGFWVKDQGDYADWAELTNLDSATGTTGMVLLEFGSVGLYGRNFAENRKRFNGSFGSCGAGTLKGMDHKTGRMAGWQALKSYGYANVDSSIVIRTDGTAPMSQDGWHAEVTIELEDLPGYLRSKWDLPVND
jgi:hypothetical protein